jgi:hypothetical protein
MDEKTKVIIIGAARGTVAEIAGTEYYFLYDGNALFKIQEEFGPCIMPELSLKAVKGVDNIMRVSEILTDCAVQKCKKYGITDVAAFKKEDFLLIDTAPYMFLDLQKACGDAADIGYVREIKDENEEIDLILIKHQKKTDINEQPTSKTE